MIQLVALDVAGTTVNDDGVVIQAFKKAFSQIAPESWQLHATEWTKYAFDTMGQSKIKVFTEILGDAYLAEAANDRFETAYLELIEAGGVSPIAGAESLIRSLRDRGIKVALTTGFSRQTLDPLLAKLGWGELLDITVVPSEAGEGRPSPAMIRFAAAAFGITEPSQVVVVGDTESDMQAGVAFGALRCIGVLSGAHARDQLVKAGASDVVNSVAEVQNLLFA